MLREKIAALQKYIILRKATFIIAAFLLGVAIHSCTPLKILPNWIWVISAGLIAAAFLWRRKLGSLPYILLLAMTAGLVRFDSEVPRMPEFGVEADYLGTIQKVTVGTYGISATVKTDAGVKLETSGLDWPKIGSTVKFTCAAKQRTRQDDWSDFRYAGHLHRASANCTAKNARVLELAPWWDARQLMKDYRGLMTKRILDSVRGDRGALIAGVLYGEDAMSEQTQDAFRTAGLTHIIAVSGSNFTIVVAMVFSLMLGAGLSRQRAFWVTSAAIAGFALFVGFSASVVRAAIMGWLVILARHVGRRPMVWHLLMLAATGICLLDPWAMVYDAGFALSFLATMGLMIWTPRIMERITNAPELFGVKEAIITTLAATMMTAPYSALVFGRLTLVGLVTNVLAVPLVPWLMLSGAVTLIWGSWPGYGIINLPSVGFAELIIRISLISKLLPWLDINSQEFSVAIILIWYGLMAYFYFNLAKKKLYQQGK